MRRTVRSFVAAGATGLLALTATACPPPPPPSATNCWGTNDPGPDLIERGPIVSGDGHWVAFASGRTDLGSDSSTYCSVFIRHLPDGVVTHVVSKGYHAYPKAITSDGRYVLSQSGERNFLTDRVTGVTKVTTLWANADSLALADDASSAIGIAAEGQDAGRYPVIRRWRRTPNEGTTLGWASAATMTPDGLTLATMSDGTPADPLGPGPTLSTWSAATGHFTHLLTVPGGTNALMNGDGTAIAFNSTADLAPGAGDDGDGDTDAFVYDIATGTVTRAGAASPSTATRLDADQRWFFVDVVGGSTAHRFSDGMTVSIEPRENFTPGPSANWAFQTPTEADLLYLP